MGAHPPRIVVAGDVSIDWLQTTAPAAASSNLPHSWQRSAAVHRRALPGGALLLARMVREALPGAAVFGHRSDELHARSPEEAIHAILELAPFPYSDGAGEHRTSTYRIERFCGYAGPSSNRPLLEPLQADEPGADLVVLDDAGNGFRDAPQTWPAALVSDANEPIVVLKMGRPLATGGLWNHLRKHHAEQTVVIVRADDLRAAGVQISRSLSWERTGTDFVWQLAANPELLELANCTHLVVLFDLDGAVYHSRCQNEVSARLYYDPAGIEGAYRAAHPGEMVGCTSAFVAALTARAATGGLEALGDGVRDGLQSARRLLREGFGAQLTEPDYPGAVLFQSSPGGASPLADVLVPPPAAHDRPDPGFWRILRDKPAACLEEIAYDYVIHGSAAALRGVPEGRFGFLRTIDRAEIESYRSVQNLMREYLATERPKRPLSIAVFGPPGSGKSFGVEQVARSVAPRQVETLTFNVSQFESSAQLVSALHLVRDVVLGGHVPLVFFDEFDSSFGGRLGWLKYFLAPMQDGAFKDGESIHPIGKAIFVFAGGTCHNFAQFAGEPSDTRKEEQGRAFIDAKGPDFVSRLRGYVDIMGPNPLGEDDDLFMMRRGMLLRSLLERKARQLIDGAGRACIDSAVLRALIKVPQYKHGVRSMEAILDMSSLAGRACFEQAALPHSQQLELHVHAEAFSRLVLRDVLFGTARERLARAIHEHYRKTQTDRPPEDPAMQPWEQLRDELKESNRLQADHIPEKLRAIGYRFSPAPDGEPRAIVLTEEEVEILAEKEHERWVAEKRLTGHSLGPERDYDTKTSPYLVAWSELPQEVKDTDRRAVRIIPELMATGGFEIYRC